MEFPWIITVNSVAYIKNIACVFVLSLIYQILVEAYCVQEDVDRMLRKSQTDPSLYRAYIVMKEKGSKKGSV